MDAAGCDGEAAGSGKQDVAADWRDPHASGSAEAGIAKWWITRSRAEAKCKARGKAIERYTVRFREIYGGSRKFDFRARCLSSVGCPPSTVGECVVDLCPLPPLRRESEEDLQALLTKLLRAFKDR